MITLQCASMPQRLYSLTRMLNSILPQVDRARVILNNYDRVPLICLNEKVEVIRHDNSGEDGSRFIKADTNDYTIMCDDDIEYPPNFVDYMKAKHAIHGGMVTIMGKNLKPRPIKSYYRDELIHYATFKEVTEDVQVEIPGMCGTFWGPDIKISNQDCPVPNSDVCVAVAAKRKGFKITVVSHRADFVTNLMPYVPGTPSIFEKYCKDDSAQTAFINAHL
jgi:hypothetical protein